MASTNSPALLLPANPGSTNSALQEDIHGIKPPVFIPGGYIWLWISLAALLLLLAALWYWKKFRKYNVPPKPAIVIPPHRKAKDRLRSANELLSDPYKFCSLVSEVVRVYLEERFTLHAPERTTEEFLEEIRLSPSLNLEHQNLLLNFLTQCDLVKFARHEPTVGELKALLDSALKLIDETAPAGPAETSTVTTAQAA